MTSGIVLGLITGLTTGMLAVGIVLVYKASRFVNLAHGQLGTLSAVMLATLVLDRGWSWWAAFPLVVSIGALVGFMVERLAIRRMRRHRRGAITYLLVTLGVGQLLLSFAYVPSVAPDKTALFRSQYPLPFTGVHRVLGTDLTGAHLMVLVVVPVTIGALAAFLRYSILGKSIRAAASNPDAARLCGISVNRVSAVTWGLAGALSAITAVLLAPGQSVLNPSALGPGLLLRALGAAAVGGFVSIPAAMVGGIVLGLVEQVTLAWTGNGADAQLAVFVAVIAILVIGGRRISTAVDNDDVAEDRPPVRVPPGVADRAIVRSHRALLGLVALVAGVVIPLLPYFSRESNRFSLVIVLVLATVGIGLTMLLGWAGQVSLGHFALLGVGGYVASNLGEDGRSLPLILLVAGAVGAVLMVAVGLPALRLRGLTLAVTTLGFAVVAPTWLFSQPWFGSEGRSIAHVPDLGLAGIDGLRTQLSIYYTALGLLALTAAAAGALRRSQAGRLMIAGRDNGPALSSFGVTPASIKVATLALSGFVAAASGVIWGLAWDNVSADLVQPAQSLAVLAIPVVGGLGSVAGAIAGAVIVYFPTFFLAPELSGILGEFGENPGLQLLIAGSGLVFIPLAYPGGVAGVADRLWERFLRSLDASVSRWRPAAGAHPLEVDGASLDFGGVHALRDVGIHVRDGEIVGLIGPNGAGKTTLLNAISGQLPLKTGSVAIGGHDVTNLAAELRSGYGLGRSFQDARLFPGLTVAEAVQVALSNRHRTGVVASMLRAPWARAADRNARAEADALLATTGLTDWADTLTGDLSTGLRRMTDLAMQIAAQPKVLLLDEPTAGVAQREGEALGPVLRRIREELDCSILIVEHDMPLLMGLCDRIYALEAGRVVAEGTPEEIRNDPAVIASYLGTDAVAIQRSGKRRPTTKASTNAPPRRVLRATK
jgi:ABC-type branched-subunit amino acid transport system ATPase component/ABC-type branched-subunit amino acid transport system permease subunit